MNRYSLSALLVQTLGVFTTLSNGAVQSRRKEGRHIHIHIKRHITVEPSGSSDLSTVIR
jgi:hypothetical protein